MIDLDQLDPDCLPDELAVSVAAIAATGRKARGPREVDLLIAATAMAAEIPPYARNDEDFRGIEHVVAVVGV